MQELIDYLNVEINVRSGWIAMLREHDKIHLGIRLSPSFTDFMEALLRRLRAGRDMFVQMHDRIQKTMGLLDGAANG